MNMGRVHQPLEVSNNWLTDLEGALLCFKISLILIDIYSFNTEVNLTLLL